MPVRSAGLLIHRLSETGPEVLLVHPGGAVLGKEGRGRLVDPEGIDRSR